jgi:hypothetical protein
MKAQAFGAFLQAVTNKFPDAEISFSLCTVKFSGRNEVRRWEVEFFPRSHAHFPFGVVAYLSVGELTGPMRRFKDLGEALTPEALEVLLASFNP